MFIQKTIHKTTNYIFLNIKFVVLIKRYNKIIVG